MNFFFKDSYRARSCYHTIDYRSFETSVDGGALLPKLSEKKNFVDTSVFPFRF